MMKIIKNNKMKGFTLIELLAVIVILAIIALIATPLILNVISDAKKGSFQASSYNIVKALENGYFQTSLKGSPTEKTIYEYQNGEEFKVVGNIKLSYKGENPSSGKIIINSDGRISSALYSSGFCAIKGYNHDEIIIKQLKEIDCKLEELIDISGANHPVLTSGMTPIKWDENNNEIEINPNNPEWYNYNEKKWANAKTVDGSYWVWVPRYAYKITSGYHSNIVGTIDVVFLNDKTTSNLQNIKIETSGYEAGVKDTSMHHFLHPAFNQGGEEISGYWVAKFEPSGTLDNIKILPNEVSIRNKTIGEQFNASLNMKYNNMYGWDSDNVEPHMMTNLEWGGVGYLTVSTYGNNKDVEINDNSNNITAGGNYILNKLQSSTANVYGIYDLSGGSRENLAAYVDNGNVNLTGYGDNITLLDNKYKNVYQVGSEDNTHVNYETNKNIYGDAGYEVTSGIDYDENHTSSWYINHYWMPSTSWPFFVRGGHRDYDGSGIFTLEGASGVSWDFNSFRPVIFIQK